MEQGTDTLTYSAAGSGRLGFYLTDEEGSFKGSEEDITVSLSVSPAPVSSYNSMYRADARLLPEGTYSLGECVLTAGETEGEKIRVNTTDRSYGERVK